MTLDRRRFLTLVTTSIALSVLGVGKGKSSATPRSLNFTPVKLPLPLPSDGTDPATQKIAYRTYEVIDDLVLPDGFTYDIVAVWGDSVGDSRFGYNNDYLSFVETKPGEGYLTVNFEYLSGRTWMQTFERAIGKSLPFAEVRQKTGEGGRIAAYNLEEDELKQKIVEISREGLIDQGIGVISLKRDASGRWRRTYSDRDRRVTGVSGLTDGRYLRATGPATLIFDKKNKKGYEDGLGAKIIGTFQNCAGGTTPWGTVFSAEENFQDQVSEPVLADGSSLHPDTTPFILTSGRVDGRGNVFGLAGNKYGWMVEIDPADPNDYGTKHTWLGRFRHEAVAFLARPGQPIAVYSGCDRRGGHVYKFVSDGKIANLKDKKNSRLFESGKLYGAKFNPDGTGRWIALEPATAIDPVLPSSIGASRGDGVVSLPNRDRTVTDGELLLFKEDADILAYKDKYRTLGDLYEGTPEEKQGAILIDAHYAATAAGVTCTGRPEDTEVSEDGTLYITFTSGTPSPRDGGADRFIFQGPRGEVPYEFGWIMSLKEDGNDPASLTFRWEMAATGGEPAAGGMGFSNPDNVAFDRRENLWMVSDISNSGLNKAIVDRYREGVPLNQTELLGVFGNNAAWVLPKGDKTAVPFAIGPMETELTGPYFTDDSETLFLAVQHPGEDGGIRENMAYEERKFVMTATDGEEFIQTRKVPLGSNWPGKQANDIPRPAVVAIRRANGKAIV